VANLRKMYRTRRRGDFPDAIEIAGVAYAKVQDLRYGTNPNQAAAFYRPADGRPLVLGAMRELKTGMSGLSQTNLEDMHRALEVVKFFAEPAVAVMKHCNPSGAAVRRAAESLADVYIKARDCDPQAAFGSVVGFNVPVDVATAEALMTSVVHAVCAPSYEDGVLEILCAGEKYGVNKEIRVVEVGDISALPKFVGDDAAGPAEVKVFADGSVVLAEPYLSSIRSVADLSAAETADKKRGRVRSEVAATDDQIADLLFAWYVCINTRSNSCVVAKNGATLAAGTGQQDRVGAFVDAARRVEEKYEGGQSPRGAVVATDGFLPFRDSVDVAADAGWSAILSPGGSISDYEVIAAANERGLAMLFTGERCFSHH